MEEIEIVDRYSALGIPRPNPKTVCLGQCEGTGYVPESDKTDPLWQEAEAKNPSEDGYHFLKCADCNGTGLINKPLNK